MSNAYRGSRRFDQRRQAPQQQAAPVEPIVEVTEEVKPEVEVAEQVETTVETAQVVDSPVVEQPVVAPVEPKVEVKVEPPKPVEKVVSKASKEMAVMLDAYKAAAENNEDTKKRTPMFVGIIRHVLAYPEVEVIDELYKFFNSAGTVLAEDIVLQHLNGYTKDIQIRVSTCYTLFFEAIRSKRKKKVFGLDPKAVRAMLKCDPIVDHVMAKIEG